MEQRKLETVLLQKCLIDEYCCVPSYCWAVFQYCTRDYRRALPLLQHHPVEVCVRAKRSDEQVSASLQRFHWFRCQILTNTWPGVSGPATHGYLPALQMDTVGYRILMNVCHLAALQL